MKLLIYAIATTLVFAGNIAAQEVRDPDIPEYIIRVIEQDRERAVDIFAKRMLDVDPDGNLSEDAITKYGMRARASFRAAEMERFLVHDLNLDGVLSVEEIVDLKRYTKISRRPDARIAFRVLKADTNADGQLSFEEMAQSIIAETKDLSQFMRQTRNLHDLLVFDQDKDGTLTLEEMLLGVQKLSVPCDC